MFAPEKVTSWDTRMEMLGWSIDTVAMTTSVPQEKVVQLRALLDEWPVDRREAPVKAVRSLLGKMLHLSEVVRPGKFFVRRILNQLGLAPLKTGEVDAGIVGGGRFRPGVVRLGREFHDDIAFWRLVIEMATGSDGITRLEAPLFSLYLQPPCRIIISDASGDAMGGYCLETGWWWRIDFSEDIRARLRLGVRERRSVDERV